MTRTNRGLDPAGTITTQPSLDLYWGCIDENVRLFIGHITWHISIYLGSDGNYEKNKPKQGIFFSFRDSKTLTKLNNLILLIFK